MNYYNTNFYQNYQPRPIMRIVDSLEMVRAAEVPIGTYGLFPKADLSEVYSKTWNPDGTTKIMMYKPQEIQPPQVLSQESLLERISLLEEKVSQLSQAPEKEVDLSDF